MSHDNAVVRLISRNLPEELTCPLDTALGEAPRGTLFHHYKIDDQGLIRWANLIIATGHNSVAMNKSILQVAKHFVRGEKLTPGMLNRVEEVIRAYDPCLSCSTHAAGQMLINVQLVNSGGEVVDELRR
jgi:NAD-reducing hydrogenase large subunit